MTVSSRDHKWPGDLLDTVGEYLPGSIGEVILQRAAEQPEIGADAWLTSVRRPRLIDYLCRRAEIYLKYQQRGLFREALEKAARKAQQRTPAPLPVVTPSRSHRSPPGSPRSTLLRYAVRSPSASPRLKPAARSPSLQERVLGSARLPVAPIPSRRSATGTQRIEIQQEIDILTARTEALAIASEAGAGVLVRTRAATIVSELARNIFRYAGRGQIRLHISGTQLTIEAIDKGPGIPNLREVLSGHYESSTGMGMGLLGSRKLADEFSVQSSAGQGTHVTAGLKLG